MSGLLHSRSKRPRTKRCYQDLEEEQVGCVIDVPFLFPFFTPGPSINSMYYDRGMLLLHTYTPQEWFTVGVWDLLLFSFVGLRFSV